MLFVAKAYRWCYSWARCAVWDGTNLSSDGEVIFKEDASLIYRHRNALPEVTHGKKQRCCA